MWEIKGMPALMLNSKNAKIKEDGFALDNRKEYNCQGCAPRKISGSPLGSQPHRLGSLAVKFMARNTKIEIKLIKIN